MKCLSIKKKLERKTKGAHLQLEYQVYTNALLQIHTHESYKLSVKN